MIPIRSHSEYNLKKIYNNGSKTTWKKPTTQQMEKQQLKTDHMSRASRLLQELYVPCPSSCIPWIFPRGAYYHSCIPVKHVTASEYLTYEQNTPSAILNNSVQFWRYHFYKMPKDSILLLKRCYATNRAKLILSRKHWGQASKCNAGKGKGHSGILIFWLAKLTNVIFFCVYCCYRTEFILVVQFKYC